MHTFCCMHTKMYVCIQAKVQAYRHICMNKPMYYIQYIFSYVYIYIYIYIYIFICIYIYIYMYMSFLSMGGWVGGAVVVGLGVTKIWVGWGGEDRQA